MRVFFTYIYGRGETYTFGGRANTGWPLTFSNSAARSMARNILSDGDLVFGVISSSPDTALSWRKVKRGDSSLFGR
ncbi:hypothetical protein KU6B_47110 [Mameliella alba]|nr:hypothetical protein KU6B_47110 [Mameliella alba]